MAFNLGSLQDSLLTHLRDKLSVDVFEVAIPDWDTLKSNKAGEFYPYVGVQLQMPLHARGETFAGVWSADYDLPVDLQAVAPTAKMSRELANLVYEAVLGFSVEHGGGFKPRFGGAVLPLQSNDGTVQAFITPMSFVVRAQLFN